MTQTLAEEARYAREALAKYSPQYGTPAQVATVTKALDAGVRVLCVDAMGELSFLVFRPVPPELEQTLDAMRGQWTGDNHWPLAGYVTDNPNWKRTPYWDVELGRKDIP
jgi:hypothetical protein